MMKVIMYIAAIVLMILSNFTPIWAPVLTYIAGISVGFSIFYKKQNKSI